MQHYEEPVWVFTIVRNSTYPENCKLFLVCFCKSVVYFICYVHNCSKMWWFRYYVLTATSIRHIYVPAFKEHWFTFHIIQFHSSAACALLTRKGPVFICTSKKSPMINLINTARSLLASQMQHCFIWLQYMIVVGMVGLGFQNPIIVFVSMRKFAAN